MKKRFLLVCALVSAFVLAACGDGGSDDRLFAASEDLTVNANAATGPSLARAFKEEVFVFPNGVPEFGTTTTTTLVIHENGSTPTFTLTNGGNVATGQLLFGSCIFKITQSTFVPPSPLLVGNTITIPNCQFLVRTRTVPANNVVFTRNARWILSTATSNDTPVEVSINPGGQVTVNGVVIGTVTLVAVTGS
jgi:hypothetical protein